MAEPMNELILLTVQQIQQTLALHTRQHEDHSRRFDKIDQNLEDSSASSAAALGFATRANIRHESVNERLEEISRRNGSSEDFAATGRAPGAGEMTQFLVDGKQTVIPVPSAPWHACTVAGADISTPSRSKTSALGRSRAIARSSAICFGLSVAAMFGEAGQAHETSASAGEPAGAKAATAVTKIEIREGNGTLLFSPDRVNVATDAVVRFVVHNGGALEHEFVLGTKAANAAHAKMMAAMPGMAHHDANAITLQPGATKSLTWRFTKSGTFEFACLLPGHYEAGMHGAVNVR